MDASKADAKKIVLMDDVDLTIYGATSFVAKHVLRYLMQLSLSLPGKLTITLAGRNEAKLMALHKDMDTKMANQKIIEHDPPGFCEFDMFVAESQDLEALTKMAKRTKVVLNCAGPFSKYSSNVVAACATCGTNYVDITGEISWAGEMRRKHGAAAEKSGARIISFCGFDSIPSDLAVFAAVQALKKETKNDNLAIEKASTWHSLFGRVNGGTLLTMAEMPIDFKKCFSQKVPFLMDDPLVLTPPSVQLDPKMVDTRNRLAKAEWWNQLFGFDSIFMMGVSIPFLMAPANSKIVFASAIALNYGPNFVYRERFLPAGFRFTTHLKTLSIVPAIFTQIVTVLAMILIKMPIVGSFILNWIFPPGTGVPDEECQSGFAQVYAEVTSPVDASGKYQRANCMIIFKGDPGNWVTAQCVSEAALSLIFNKKDLPPRSKDGFGTPAELLGPVLLGRLKNSPVREVEVVTHARKDLTGMEFNMFPQR